MARSDDKPSDSGALPTDLPALVSGQDRPPSAKPTAPQGGRLPADVLSNGTMVGEYLIDRRIGEGGMGAVYAATHPIIGKRVAIKVLKAGLSQDPGLVRRFIDEARAVNKIGHPNIIDIFSFGQLSDGRHYFVMEFLEGETLAALMNSRSLSSSEAELFLRQTCAALEAAHREKIVHRDLKPDNILIARPKHGEAFVKVLDFGIAKLLETETINVTQTGVTMGTPSYMSPEQCVGQGVDHRTDIYAMGVLFYQIFAGRLPFEGRSFAEIVAQQITATPPPPSQFRAMSPALNDLILSCIEKDASKRPQSAAETSRLLVAALASPVASMPTMPQVSAHDPRPGSQSTRAGFADNRAKVDRMLSPRGMSASRKGLLLAGTVAVAVAVAVAVSMGSRKPAPVVASPPPAAPASPSPATPPSSPVGAAPNAAAPSPSPAATAPGGAPATAAAPAPPARAPSAAGSRPAKSAGAPKTNADKARVDDKGLVTDNPFK